MSINQHVSKFKRDTRRFLAWLRVSTERFAIGVTVLGSVLICATLFFWPQSSAPSGGHDHGGHHEEGEEADGEKSIELDEEILSSSGMNLGEAKAVEIKPIVSARGQITENANRSMNVKPRFSGIVRTVYKDFGDLVRKGDPLLLVESASTRASYTIRTAIDGIVADKRVVAGAFIPENESVMRIVSLESVWFQTRVPLRDAEKLQVGLDAEIADQILGVKGKGKLLYVSPVVDLDTQACDVRVELDNSLGNWKIGSFAEGHISLKSLNVKVAVKTSAIQSMNEQLVIFKKSGDDFSATSVVIGQADEEWTEVTSGIEPGDMYIESNSFLAKAELMKSTAAHEH